MVYAKNLILSLALSLLVFAPQSEGLTLSTLDSKIKETIESLHLGRHYIETDYHTKTLVVSGYVSSPEEKMRVVEALKKLEGIEAVEDKLEVKEMVKVSNPEDPTRKVVLEAVKGLNGLGSYEIDITSEDGQLILTGTVSSEKDRNRIGEAARLAAGKHQIINRILLTPPLSDAEIEQNVWDALNKEKDLELSGVTLKVSQGVVTFYGEKPNHRLIDHILAIANMADGVKEIKSQMKVKK